MNPILKNMQTNNLKMIRSLFSSKNPDTLYKEMLKTNPLFARFVDENRNKTIEQIASENGVDMELVKQFAKK